MSSSADLEIRSSEGRLGPTDDRPLTEQELKLLQRLLSDPFSFPVAYKTWLVSYLETSDLSLPVSAVQGLTNLLGISGASTGTLGILPAGIIFPFGGSAAPTGALLCDGAAYPISGYQRLYDAIGTAYGGSGGSFNVPDLQGRMPVGRGLHADVNALGKNDALPLGSRRPKHKHTVTDPGHAHDIDYYNAGAGEGGFHGLTNKDIPNNATQANAAKAKATGLTVGPQSGAEPTDSAAFLVVNYIIIV